MRHTLFRFAALVILCSTARCRPSDFLTVPAPSGEVGYTSIQGRAAAEAAFGGARSQLANVIGQSDGLLTLTMAMSDEFSYANNNSNLQVLGTIDARRSAASAVNGNNEAGDTPYELLLQARQSLLVSIPALEQYEPASGVAHIGEAYALVGYTELLIAEDYCAGATMTDVLPGGGWQYGTALSTDSLLGLAQVHFNTALTHVATGDTIAALAHVGLARALMDRGQYAAADTAVDSVPAAFVYNTQLEPIYTDLAGNFNYYSLLGGIPEMTVANEEGGVGLPFTSTHDPRLVLDSTVQMTSDGKAGLPDSIMYYPLKFYPPGEIVATGSVQPSTGLIPLATGVEAQLIVAEAELAANPSGTAWLTTLNTLRNSGCPNPADETTCGYGTGQVPVQPHGLFSLTDPGTPAGRLALLFSERAFWLFGTGTRLGDMRRLVRQYSAQGFTANTVYPNGAYENGLFPPITTYGSDVDLTLPTLGTTPNPDYKGCTSGTTTP